MVMVIIVPPFISDTCLLAPKSANLQRPWSFTKIFDPWGRRKKFFIQFEQPCIPSLCYCSKRTFDVPVQDFVVMEVGEAQ